MKTIPVLFKSILVLEGTNNVHHDVYVVAGMMLYLIAITSVLAFFRINKNASNHEE